MAAITRKYLFDAERFREFVAPLADQIGTGDKSLLAEAAADLDWTSLGTRHVRKVYASSPSDLESEYTFSLSDLGSEYTFSLSDLESEYTFSLSDLGSEHTEFPDERRRLRFWLKVTLSMSLRPINGLGRYLSEPSLRGASFVDKLTAAGWSAEDVQRLVIGNDLALLLTPKNTSSIPQQVQPTEAGPIRIEPGQQPKSAGWLGPDEVTELLGKIRAAQVTSNHDSSDPVLSALYGYLEIALARAYISRMGLFTVVTT